MMKWMANMTFRARPLPTMFLLLLLLLRAWATIEPTQGDADTLSHVLIVLTDKTLEGVERGATLQYTVQRS